MAGEGEMVRRDDTQVYSGSEQTRSTPYFSPAVDIFETQNELVVMADMPGVEAKNLSIDLDDNVLTIEGEVGGDQGTDYLAQEYQTGRFWRQFTLGEQIDRARIDAQLSNGELKLVLPKAEAAKPRRIEVKAQ